MTWILDRLKLSMQAIFISLPQDLFLSFFAQFSGLGNDWMGYVNQTSCPNDALPYLWPMAGSSR